MPAFYPPSTGKDARCSAAGSLKNALKKAAFIIKEQFGFADVFKYPPGVDDCLSIRKHWEKWTGDLIIPRKPRVAEKFLSTVKSTKRIFDVSCKVCDKKIQSEVKIAWRDRVRPKAPMPTPVWCRDNLWVLRRHVRSLASGWGSRLEEERKDEGGLSLGDRYVPDQQGCYETRSSEGGTLATSSDPIDPRDFSRVRLGVAKTKGKMRVVTMQPAHVKRVLRPVHNALYSHLSSFSWLVRGDVQRGDYEAVISDKRKGESLISGDYESATDLIYLEVVQAIVEVLAEDGRLSPEERGVLLGSFRDLRCDDIGTKGDFPISRGSMMGNLCSFPILCLLNKACFDIACDIYHGPGANRVGRFNGDDCMFPGSHDFFLLWKEITGSFGLKVNDLKTGISLKKLELNSQCFLLNSGLTNKPVISFLRPNRDDPSCLFKEVLEGISTLKTRIQHWVLNVAMRYELALRKIDLATIGKRWFSTLVKRKWFRAALVGESVAEVKVEGVPRTPEMVVETLVKPEYYEFVHGACAKVQREYVERWTGVRTVDKVICPFAMSGRAPVVEEITVKPVKRILVKRRDVFRLSEFWVGCRFSRSPVTWTMIVPREVSELICTELSSPWVDRKGQMKNWVEDSPLLGTSVSLITKFSKTYKTVEPPVLFYLNPNWNEAYNSGW